MASAELLLLDETFRKSLAVKLAETMKACPGNGGQEDQIERLKKTVSEPCPGRANEEDEENSDHFCMI